jgi:hypothetical protein
LKRFCHFHFFFLETLLRNLIYFQNQFSNSTDQMCCLRSTCIFSHYFPLLFPSY